MTVVAMSRGELSRYDTLLRVKRRELRVEDAAVLLGLTRRQVSRLLIRLREEGPEGLVSRKRGRPSNRRHSDIFRDQVIAIVREHYSDFGPTLAREYLIERHGITVACETLRQLMITAGLWKDREARRPRPYQPRYRRDCRGELIQIDGSKHWWFEDRGPQCTLLVFIDDATSELMHLRMVETENTFSYMDAILSRERRSEIGVMHLNQRDRVLPERIAEPPIARLAAFARNQAFSTIRAQPAEQPKHLTPGNPQQRRGIFRPQLATLNPQHRVKPRKLLLAHGHYRHPHIAAGTLRPLSMFVNRYGEPLSASGVRFKLAAYVKAAAETMPTLRAKHVTPHAFRHATAVHLISAGVDVTVIRSWLGHVSLDTTNHYARANLETKRKALEKVAVPTTPGGLPSWKRDASVLAWLDTL